MMKSMLGLPADPCANADRLIAAKATAETRMFAIMRLLIFMTPNPSFASFYWLGFDLALVAV
jgi:hypothetical protein